MQIETEIIWEEKLQAELELSGLEELATIRLWLLTLLPVAASSAITFHLMKTHCKITYAPRGDRKILTSRCPAMYTKVPMFYVTSIDYVYL